MNARQKALKKAKGLSWLLLLIGILVIALPWGFVLGYEPFVSWVAQYLPEEMAGVLLETAGDAVAFVDGLAGVVFFFGIAFILISQVMCANDRKRIKRTYCPECGEKYDYDEDIEWEVEDVVTGEKREEATIEVECCCGNCENERSFRVKMTTAYFDANGNLKENNLYNQMKKYFKY